MNYLLYQITNNINGKIYVGCHRTENVDDDYMGSGFALDRAMKKYGKENFTKTILENHQTEEQLYLAEAVLVDQEFVNRKDTYNIRIGGIGGWSYVNKSGLGDIGRKKANDTWLENMKDPTYAEQHGKKIKAGQSHIIYPIGGVKKHTAETIAKMSASSKGQGTGKTNSQYGTCWIHNNRVSKKIEKSDLNEYLIDGWIKGRKMKFN